MQRRPSLRRGEAAHRGPRRRHRGRRRGQGARLGARRPADPRPGRHAQQAHDRDRGEGVPRHPLDPRERRRAGRGRGPGRADARAGQGARRVGQQRLGDLHAGLQARGPRHERRVPHRPAGVPSRSGDHLGGSRYGVDLRHHLPHPQQPEGARAPGLPQVRPQHLRGLLPVRLRADRSGGPGPARPGPRHRRLPVRGGEGGRARGRAGQARPRADLDQLGRHRRPQDRVQASRPGARSCGVRPADVQPRDQAGVRAGRWPQGQVGFNAYAVVAQNH